MRNHVCGKSRRAGFALLKTSQRLKNKLAAALLLAVSLLPLFCVESCIGSNSELRSSDKSHLIIISNHVSKGQENEEGYFSKTLVETVCSSVALNIEVRFSGDIISTYEVTDHGSTFLFQSLSSLVFTTSQQE